MRRAWIRVIALSIFMTLAASGVAWAHVEFTTEEVSAGDFATLTLNVPNEKDNPTTKIRVEVPDGFVVSAVQPVPGWDHRFERQGGNVTSIVWSGGEIKPEEFQQFLVSAQTPEETGSYTWKATQTYQDGSVVEWAGPPDADEPAPVIQVGAASASEGHTHGAMEESGGHEHGAMEAGHSHSEGEMAGSTGETLADTGGVSPALLAAGIGICALVAGSILIARLRGN